VVFATEIALGGLLLAGAAPVVVVVFSSVLVRNILLDRRVPCGCFGAQNDRPAGWESVARNTLLLGLLVPSVIVRPIGVPDGPHLLLALPIAGAVVLFVLLGEALSGAFSDKQGPTHDRHGANAVSDTH